jgi:hypothetical protein
VSNEQKPYQQGEDEFDVARELAAEDDERGYVEVIHTSQKGKTATFQVRPPTMKEQEANRRAATLKGVQVVKGATDRVILPEVDGTELMIRNLISAVHVKKGGEWVRCWTLHDKETLLTRRGGADSLITKLSEAYTRATQLKSVEEEKGNSGASPS